MKRYTYTVYDSSNYTVTETVEVDSIIAILGICGGGNVSMGGLNIVGSSEDFGNNIYKQKAGHNITIVLSAIKNGVNWGIAVIYLVFFPLN